MTTLYTFDALDEQSTIEESLSPVGGLPQASRSNVLSTKIASILSSSYADSEIRNALGLLDARSTNNTSRTRRDLRLDAEKEVIDCNASILDEFGEVAEQLKRVGAIIATLNETCDQMRKHISQSHLESAPMLEEASMLMASKEQVKAKSAVLEAFNKHFIIADEDLTTLTSSAEPVDDKFFAVLNRVKQIHEDCEVLLGSENQTLGLDLMEQTSRNLDAAFKKLYNWVQRALKSLDLEDPHMSSSIRRALRVLAERPTLFKNCLDFLAEARERTLSDAFLLALTEAVGGAGRAIEFSTHDLLRYMGDMLAWVHSTTVSEIESFEGLFITDAEAIKTSIRLGKVSEPWSAVAGAEDETEDGAADLFDGQKALHDLVSRSVGAVSTILRERTELAVHQHDEPVLIYKAWDLLDFYQGIFSKLLGPESTLCKTIAVLEASTLERFEHIIQDEVDTNMPDQKTLDEIRAEEEYPGVPAYIRDSMSRRLVPIINARGPKLTPEEFGELWRMIMSRYSERLVLSDEQLSLRRSAYDQSIKHIVWVLNGYSFIIDSLRPVCGLSTRCVGQTVDEKETTLSIYTAAVGRELGRTMIFRSGIEDLLKSLDRNYPGENGTGVFDLKQDYDLSWLTDNISKHHAKLDEYLAVGYENTMEGLNELESAEVKQLIRDRAREVFLQDFERLVAALDVVDEDATDELEESLRSRFHRTMDDMEVLI